MAAAKRLTPEQIVARLRDAEKMQGHGATIPQVCKKLGVSEQTFYRWRSKYGGVEGGRGDPAEDAGA
jgi:transposase